MLNRQVRMLLRSIMAIAGLFLTSAAAAEQPGAQQSARPDVVPVSAPRPGRAVQRVEMERIYEEVKTPFKYGIILRPGENESIDCPSLFRADGKWYMVYIAIKDKVGYETMLAESANLLRWTPRGKILPFSGTGWDQWQAAGGIALVDPTWGGTGEAQMFDGKYWMSYIGGAKQGYEPDPLSIGMGWTNAPTQPVPWNRFGGNPVLAPDQPDARSFEQATLYKSQIVWDKDRSLDYSFVMFYNAKQKGLGIERIGMAVSDDMLHWTRFGQEPVIDNHRGISGDPQIVRIGDLWVMFYFGAGWKPGAFDTFACSYDLVHWTKWDGADLVAPSEPWDKTFAHKPWVLKHDGIVYHFYCAVGNAGRAIALAASKKIDEREGEQ